LLVELEDRTKIKGAKERTFIASEEGKEGLK
jgi:hypothetical protein